MASLSPALFPTRLQTGCTISFGVFETDLIQWNISCFKMLPNFARAGEKLPFKSNSPQVSYGYRMASLGIQFQQACKRVIHARTVSSPGRNGSDSERAASWTRGDSPFLEELIRATHLPDHTHVGHICSAGIPSFSGCPSIS